LARPQEELVPRIKRERERKFQSSSEFGDRGKL